jgi:hypothetical protein
MYIPGLMLSGGAMIGLAMAKSLALRSLETVRIGREPVVVVPLKLWQEIEGCLETQEALRAKRFLRRIQKARKDIAMGKAIYPFAEI